MDHSVYSYLRRRSLEELEVILDMCETNREQYGYLENMVLEALYEKRNPGGHQGSSEEAGNCE